MRSPFSGSRQCKDGYRHGYCLFQENRGTLIHGRVRGSHTTGPGDCAEEFVSRLLWSSFEDGSWIDVISASASCRDGTVRRCASASAWQFLTVESCPNGLAPRSVRPHSDLPLYEAAQAVSLCFKGQVKKIGDDQYSCEHDEVCAQAAEIVWRQASVAQWRVNVAKQNQEGNVNDIQRER